MRKDAVLLPAGLLAWLMALPMALLLLGCAPSRAQLAYTPEQCPSCAEWNATAEPLRLHGTTYYVGTEGLASILITSPEGHILVDAGLPESAPSLEGYLAPGEYRFDIESEPAEILTLLTEPTFATLEADGVTDEAEQLRTLTIASILEAEALPKDYATVAGIIENRLHPDNPETDGKLQIDATVIYGLGQRQLQFTQEEKEDAANEYNTYVHRGLPPGPIGAPSTEAIDAASNPEDNEYYYWVTTNIETGETKFARDYATHREYQQEYRDYCAENEEICG